MRGLYPAVGDTPDEGHDFVHLAIAGWEADVFAFLDRHIGSLPGAGTALARPRGRSR